MAFEEECKLLENIILPILEKQGLTPGPYRRTYLGMIKHSSDHEGYMNTTGLLFGAQLENGVDLEVYPGEEVVHVKPLESVELWGAIHSNPNLAQLTKRWKKKYAKENPDKIKPKPSLKVSLAKETFATDLIEAINQAATWYEDRTRELKEIKKRVAERKKAAQPKQPSWGYHKKDETALQAWENEGGASD